MQLLPEAEDALQCSVEKLKTSLRENLHACILYGSAVRGGFIPEVSDLNLLLILNHSTPEAHEAIAEALCGPVRIEPFILGREGLERSFQAFAMKFRSIRRNYRVLHGADPFKDFKVDEQLLKFLCEQALRNLRLRLTHAFVVVGRDPKRYTRYLVHSLPNLFADLSEVLRSANVEVPKDHSSRIPVLEKHFGVNAAVLSDLLELKKQRRVIDRSEAAEFHSRLFQLLNQAVRWIEAQWPPLQIRS